MANDVQWNSTSFTCNKCGWKGSQFQKTSIAYGEKDDLVTIIAEVEGIIYVDC